MIVLAFVALLIFALLGAEWAVRGVEEADPMTRRRRALVALERIVGLDEDDRP